MDLTLSTPFIAIIALLFTILLVNIGIQKNKKVLVLLGTVPLLAGSFYVSNQKQMEVESQQTLYAQQAFESLYRPDNLNIEKTGKRKGWADYQIETPSGRYTVAFKNEVEDAFEVTKEEGESLRGRKNVFDTLEMMGINLDTWSVWYEEKNSYVAETTDEQYQIQLDGDTVISIIDEEENIVFQREEEKNEPIKHQTAEKEEIK